MKKVNPDISREIEANSYGFILNPLKLCKVGFWQRPFRDEKEMEMKPSCDIQSQNEALSGKTGSGKPIKCNSNIWR